MLEALHLTLWRGSTCLFENLSCQVAPGTALLIRGPNGAGKTTLLRVLCGLTRPEQGEILWDGSPVGDRLRGQLAYSGHQPALKGDLTVRQNLEFYSRLFRRRGEPVLPIDLFGLDRCADLEVRHLSAGQKRRASLARVFNSGALVWLLDEPFTNLDADGRRLVEERVVTHLSTGGLAILAAHDSVMMNAGLTETLSLGVV